MCSFLHVHRNNCGKSNLSGCIFQFENHRMDFIHTDYLTWNTSLESTPNYTFSLSYICEVEEALMQLQKPIINFQAARHVHGRIQKFPASGSNKLCAYVCYMSFLSL